MPKSKSKSTLLSRQSMSREEDTIEDDTASYSGSDASLAANDLANETVNLQTILVELRKLRQENGEGFREVKEEVKNINRRLDEAETRILEAENRIQELEEVAMKLSKVQDEFEAKLVELEGRSRRENLRLHGIVEGSEDSSPSIPAFIENLLREKLDIPTSLDLSIERAHRSLGPRAPPEAPPRSIIVKFATSKVKDEILKRAWQKKGFMVAGKKVIVDHDYAPDVLKRRREYLEVKRVLREKKIRFQTPFPAKLRVFYENNTRVYNSAAEASKDMADRGFQVTVIQPSTTWVDKIRNTMWTKLGKNDKDHSRNGAREGYKKKLDEFRRGQTQP
uniref:LIN1 n=1 Tax=Poeciliopsis prolifica TaxID=188132 RepID=A0A0S7ERB0_9TELE